MNKNIKLSLLVSGLLFATTSLFAESTTLKDAFSKGTTSGDVTAYYENSDVDTGNDVGFSSGSIGLNYETDSLYGFSAAVGFRGQFEISEENNGDYDGAYANDAILHTASIKYANKDFFLSVGRQEIDLEWLGDYNESVVAGITAFSDTSIILGYTDRQAEVGFDTTADFDEITEKGAYVLDLKYSGFENFELNPYYYDVPDVASFYGLKVSYDNDMFGATAHYVTSSEDVGADGSIYNLEIRGNLAGVSAALGYIEADDKVGVGSIASYGDNMNPLDEGGNVYGIDAQTTYGSLSYEISGLGLTALYGKTDYAASSDTDELNLIAEYSFTDELSGAITYVDYDDEGSANDFNKIYANLTYSF